MERQASYHGQCLCGGVSLEASAIVEDRLGACHCKMCQRWAGSMLYAVSIKADQIAWKGEAHIKRAQTSDWAERAWCNECGTGLWYRMTNGVDDDFEIPMGLFDDEPDLQIASEIFYDKKLKHINFEGEHSRFSEAETLKKFGVTVEGI